MRKTTTKAFGIRLPIMQRKDDLISTVSESLMAAVEAENITLADGDIVGITEALVARTESNYATTEDIANDVRKKFNTDVLGIIFRFNHVTVFPSY